MCDRVCVCVCVWCVCMCVHEELHASSLYMTKLTLECAGNSSEHYNNYDLILQQCLFCSVSMNHDGTVLAYGLILTARVTTSTLLNHVT